MSPFQPARILSSSPGQTRFARTSYSVFFARAIVAASSASLTPARPATWPGSNGTNRMLFPSKFPERVTP
jgi:hypothetical protein